MYYEFRSFLGITCVDCIVSKWIVKIAYNCRVYLLFFSFLNISGHLLGNVSMPVK